jgi:hypothetical protein
MEQAVGTFTETMRRKRGEGDTEKGEHTHIFP